MSVKARERMLMNEETRNQASWNRRSMLQASLAFAGLNLVACGPSGKRRAVEIVPATSEGEGMPYRQFGRTDLRISEVGFGAWGIGGEAYGPADRRESLDALARAEEHGCNFIDTAMVYGDSEAIIGEFLEGRRDKWVVATKYSGQEPGMTATLEAQLARLGTDHVDLYQIHWVPKDPDGRLYEELFRLKRAGKTRYVGVSLSTVADIDYVTEHVQLDGVQLPLSLLDPLPFLARREPLRSSGLGIIARSSLKQGFLTGRFSHGSKFTDPNDQRSKWPQDRVAALVDQVERFRFLEAEHGSMVAAAARYPLSFPEVSTVIMGTMNVAQAESNFGEIPGGRLSAAALERVAELQDELGLWSLRERLARGWRRLTGRE